MVLERTDSLKNTLNDLQKAMDGIIEVMGLTVETRDPYTAGHQRRVAEIARAIAIEMGISEHLVEGVYMANLSNRVSTSRKNGRIRISTGSFGERHSS